MAKCLALGESAFSDFDSEFLWAMEVGSRKVIFVFFGVEMLTVLQVTRHNCSEGWIEDRSGSYSVK